MQLANDALLRALLLYFHPRQGTEAVSFASVIAERSEQVVTAPRGGSPPVPAGSLLAAFEPPPGRPLKLGL